MTTTRSSTLGDIESAIWRELQASARDRAHAWRTPVLATSDAQGDADARVVVLREVEPPARLLRFFTDARSPKLAQIERRPRGVLVMWSPSLRWQLRVQVSLEIHRTGPLVSSRWERLGSTSAAGDYLSALAPGVELDAGVEPQSADASDASEAGHRPAHFALVDTRVRSIDWLELHAQGSRRARFAADGAQWLQP